MTAAADIQSIQNELVPQLSGEAVLHFPDSEGFSKSNLRFTEYERPVRTRYCA